MIAGFLPDATQIHFIEPMVSRERLLERTDFELPVSMPATFGRVMRYPTKFVAEYDADLDVYHFVFFAASLQSATDGLEPLAERHCHVRSDYVARPAR